MSFEHCRESLPSRLGFLLLAAGCAIGLGNIWRFPFIVGSYGGALFVLLYLFFLAVLGYPVLVMELSIGRGSRLGIVGAYRKLAERGGKVWGGFGFLFFSGNLVLLMFYSVVCGWMMAYACKMARGELSGLAASEIDAVFQKFVAMPGSMIGWMSLGVVLAMLACGAGLRAGVERSVKWMMLLLFVMLLLLCGQALSLPGAAAGLKFYLVPDFSQLMRLPLSDVIWAALGQAFFTLSVGVGSMEIFGSYIGRERTLGKEAATIIGIDTFVAFMAGMIVFPACASFGVDMAAGPGLVFISLPNVFRQMEFGRFWGTLFFVFMSFAALTTLIAVLENIVAFVMESWHCRRLTAALCGGGLVLLLSIPCCLGYNEWSSFQPLGAGSTILDLEDFIVSDNILPCGALCIVLFCTWRFGWGWRKFAAEANAGEGMKFPEWLHWYCKWLLPLMILIILFMGYMTKIGDRQ